MKSNSLEHIHSKLGEKFTLHSNLLVYNGVANILRGIYFEKSPSRKGKGYYIWAFVQPLFLISDGLVFNFGYRLKTIDNSEFWENEILENSNYILPVINQNINYFDKNDTIQHFYELRVANFNNYINELMYIAFAACYINEELGELRLKELKFKISQQKIITTWMQDLQKLINMFLEMTPEKRIIELDKNVIKMKEVFKLNS